MKIYIYMCLISLFNYYFDLLILINLGRGLGSLFYLVVSRLFFFVIYPPSRPHGLSPPCRAPTRP